MSDDEIEEYKTGSESETPTDTSTSPLKRFFTTDDSSSIGSNTPGKQQILNDDHRTDADNTIYHHQSATASPEQILYTTDDCSSIGSTPGRSTRLDEYPNPSAITPPPHTSHEKRLSATDDSSSMGSTPGRSGRLHDEVRLDNFHRNQMAAISPDKKSYTTDDSSSIGSSSIPRGSSISTPNDIRSSDNVNLNQSYAFSPEKKPYTSGDESSTPGRSVKPRLNDDINIQSPTHHHHHYQQPTTSQTKESPSTTDESSSFGNNNNTKKLKLDDNTHVVAAHYNHLPEKGFAERSKSRIFYMRNFNNWIKSMLINQFLTKIKSSQKLGEPLRVMDMCCGKGGDLLKWEKGGITHLICTDVADVSVQQCQERYNSLIQRSDAAKYGKKFTAEFFACDSTMVQLMKKYKDPSVKLNMVSCQFAFHYCFESLTQADCMIRNAAECLLPGGYFIATIPDAYEIMRRQREACRKSFGNSVYRIDFVCDTEKPPLFGAKYKFHLEDVVDCPEFLVHFPTLIKLCKKNGLKLVLNQTFAEYYANSVDNGKKLLSRMQALETYPPRRKGDLIGEEYEYVHAKNYLESKSSRYKCIGTLSQSEWEAATLYLVCAFTKCKSTLDAEGKPVYIWE